MKCFLFIFLVSSFSLPFIFLKCLVREERGRGVRSTKNVHYTLQFVREKNRMAFVSFGLALFFSLFLSLSLSSCRFTKLLLPIDLLGELNRSPESRRRGSESFYFLFAIIAGSGSGTSE